MPDRTEQLDAFYREHHQALEAATAREAHVTSEILEDACQNAWTVLTRRPDIRLDRGGLRWLTITAIRDARRQRDRTQHAERYPATSDLQAGDPLERVLELSDHDARLGRFAQLTSTQRTTLYLQAAGHSYDELEHLTRSTRTAVNRRLVEGRRTLRQTATS